MQKNLLGFVAREKSTRLLKTSTGICIFPVLLLTLKCVCPVVFKPLSCLLMYEQASEIVGK